MARGRPPKYTEEMLAFLKKNMKGKQWGDITNLFNGAFNTAFTESQIESCCRFHRYKRFMPHKPHKGFNTIYAPEVTAFMKANYKEAGSFPKLTRLINSNFGTSYTNKQIKSWFHRQGLKLNLERGKGAIMPIGAEWVDPYGYVHIKVSTTGARAQRWRRKHYITWEAVNGKVPKGKYIIFLDGNTQNCGIENLALVDAAEKNNLVRLGLLFTDPDFTQTGIAIVKHGIAIANLLRYRYGPQTNKEKHARNSAKFTHEIRAFIKRQWKEAASYSVLAELVNSHFNTAFTYTQINQFTNRQGLHYGKHEGESA